MAVPERVLLCLAMGLPGCGTSSPASESRDAGPDATADADAAAPVPDTGPADAPADDGADGHPPSVAGAMTLYELGGAASETLALSVSFHAPAPHDYDDNSGGLGCTADHYDSVAKPVPDDVNVGFLRVSGFNGGRTLAGQPADNPIGCLTTSAYYACSYPAGESAFAAAFAPDASPLGPGPIALASNGGGGVGALYVAGSPDDGTLAVAEDLTTIKIDPTQDAVLHPTCSTACPSARFAVELTALASSSADAGWPYPSVGVVRCVFASASTVTIPHGAIAAALASDARLDAIDTVVARLPQASLSAHDQYGNVLTAEVGRGVSGTAPR
jgi:hypothetical protein